MTGSEAASGAVSADTRFLAGLFVAIAAVLAFGYSAYLAGQSRTPAPYVQPSVPSLIPPPLSCLCGTSKQSSRPFRVACPYCRATIEVQAPGIGEKFGATVETFSLKPSAK